MKRRNADGTSSTRITYVRLAEVYRIDEVDGDGVARTEISPAWLPDEVFAEHLAALVADYRRMEVSRGAIDDDAVVWEWGRRRHHQKRAS